MYIPLALAGILMLAGGSYAYYREYTAARNANAQLASSTAMLHALQNTLASTTQERDALTAEQSKNQTFEGQIRQLSGTVGKLDQLSKTDPQLLAKYSKVYFLNENYVPAALSPIDPAFLFEPSRIVQAHAQIQSHLYDLLTAAQADGIDLLVLDTAHSALRQRLRAVIRLYTGQARQTHFPRIKAIQNTSSVLPLISPQRLLAARSRALKNHLPFLGCRSMHIGTDSFFPTPKAMRIISMNPGIGATWA
jgi:hypothetical protein